jgi:hypothetical protein
MIVLSFNARGVGGVPKILALKRLVQSCNLYVIMIQETMCIGVKVVEAFSNWLKGWSLYSIDVEGFSRG